MRENQGQLTSRDNPSNSLNQGDRSRDRESIWSIPQHLRRWYVALFSGQFLLLLILVVLEQFMAIPWATAILNLYRGMGPIILPMVGSTYVALEGIMLAEWLRERDRRKVEEILEKGREEGMQEKDRQWLEWYERLQAAQRDGRPFNEPPPVNPENRPV